MLFKRSPASLWNADVNDWTSCDVWVVRQWPKRDVHHSGKGGPTLLALSWLPVPHPEDEEGRSPEGGPAGLVVMGRRLVPEDYRWGYCRRRTPRISLLGTARYTNAGNATHDIFCSSFLHALKVTGLRGFLSERNDHFANLRIINQDKCLKLNYSCIFSISIYILFLIIHIDIFMLIKC